MPSYLCQDLLEIIWIKLREGNNFNFRNRFNAIAQNKNLCSVAILSRIQKQGFSCSIIYFRNEFANKATNWENTARETSNLCAKRFSRLLYWVSAVSAVFWVQFCTGHFIFSGITARRKSYRPLTTRRTARFRNRIIWMHIFAFITDITHTMHLVLNSMSFTIDVRRNPVWICSSAVSTN